MKLFSDKTERYTEEAVGFKNKLAAAVEPTFREYVKQGASIRELAAIMHHLVLELECLELMGK